MDKFIFGETDVRPPESSSLIEMQLPILHIFTISHYCEKARWALERLRVPHNVRIIAPGDHVKIARAHGLKRGTVPFLTSESKVIQGSQSIVDWAVSVSPDPELLSGTAAAGHDVEQRLDEVLGVHVRRWYYSEAILEHSSIVKPIFMHGISRWEKLKLNLSWPMIKKLMIERMDLGLTQGQESKQIVLTELEWLESLLHSNRQHLIGDRLSRSDITAASLLAPLVNPPEHPCSDLIAIPPRLAQDYARMADRRIWEWVTDIYQRYRRN